MIEVTELFKSYGRRKVLKGLDFVVKPGGVTAFLGANGAGKTTTLDILCGCLGKDQGKVLIGGQDIDQNPQEALGMLGYLPEHPPLYGELSVYESLSYGGGLRRLSSSHLKKKIPQLLDLMSLSSEKYRLVKTLSKGMKQRLGFALAMIHDPSVLILDEPMDGLDPEQIIDFCLIIKKLAESRSILLSSHNLAQVEGFCDHVVILKEGKVSASGQLEDLVQRLSATRTYQLRLESNIELLLKTLKSKEYQEKGEAPLSVKSYDAKHGLIDIELPEKGFEQNLDLLIETVVAHKCGLRLLTSQQKTLEDVYFDMTKR